MSLPTDVPRRALAHTCKLLSLHLSRSMTRLMDVGWPKCSHKHTLCQAMTQAHPNTWAYTHTHQGVWIVSLSRLKLAWDVRARFFWCSYRMWVHFQLCNRDSYHNALWKKRVRVILKLPWDVRALTHVQLGQPFQWILKEKRACNNHASLGCESVFTCATLLWILKEECGYTHSLSLS
jgi:hypothetical protein